MRRSAEPAPPAATRSEPDVVPASGVYRAAIILLGVWTIFAGLALVTQGVPALSLGANDAAERIIGSQMLMLVPIYALIVWRPDENRLLRWIPYAAQLSIMLPFVWDTLITGDHTFTDGALLFVAAAVFLGVLVYLRSSAHPLGFFAVDSEDEEIDEDAEYDEEEGDLLDEEEEPESGPERNARGRRYRRST
ncbi:MAG: hypothetical protein WD359_01950 [Dehalococcoidia bacterium]